jgi:hypothetical protein
MKLVKPFLSIAGCLCLISLGGCSRPESSAPPSSTQPAPPANNQAAQPAVTTATPTAAGSSAQAGEKVPGSVEVNDELHTPPMGSPERQALMDALREQYNKSHSYRGSITFVVNYLKVHNGWAWTYPEPRSTDPRDQFGENSGFLLHQADGRWQVMKVPPMVDDPDDPENLDYPTRKDVERFRKMYPSIPTDIFPIQQ